MTRLLPRTARALAVALAASAAACASAEKRFEQGVQLEQQGRPEEAAARYVAALRRDPSLAEARARLQTAGDEALAGWRSEARLLDADGQSAAAAEALLRADALRADAGAVGVTLSPGPEYERFRRAIFDRAIAAAVDGADLRAPGARSWTAVTDLLSRADRWDPSPAQREAIVAARVGAQVGWAEEELRLGRYRSAYERADAAARLADPAGPLGRRAQDVQAEALARGTVRIAVLPVVATNDRVRERLPDEALAELNDALITEHWSRAPLFVRVADPIAVQREARRLGFTRRAPSTAEAATLARNLGADLVVIPLADSVELRLENASETRRPARTRDGADTAYAERSGRTWMRTRVRVAVIDAAQRRVLDERAIHAEAGAQYRRVVYAGNWRQLLLSPEERQRFEREDRSEQELVREMVEGMRRRLADDVFSRATRHLQ